MTNPYADTAELYLLGGWHPFPLPYGKKIPPPAGFTGYTAVPVTAKHVAAWIEKADGPQNIGLHLPEHVLGIDVDHYGDKTGADTLATFEAQLGTLPDTWVSSAREGLSGIRFYRVPAGRMWVGQLAHQGSVDIISHHERFAVIWPSTHPDGGTYAWTDPDGFPSDDVPSVDLLPELPAAWVAHLDKGPLTDRDLKADLADSDAWQWLEDYTFAGEPCRWLRRVIADAAVDLRTGNDHHGAIRGPVMTVVRAGEQGHVGALAALQQLRDIFEESLAGHRSWDENEWVRLVVGAVATCTVQDQRTDFDDRGCCPEDPPEVADLNVDEETPEAEPGESWQVLDLNDVLNGDYIRPQPSVGCYGDAALFYPGKVNGLAGESGAGKSWVALVSCAQEVKLDQHVIYIDFEDDVASVVDRMLGIGCSPDSIREFFHYIRPHERLGDAGKQNLLDAVRQYQPTLVVIDSTGESMAIEGVNANDDGEVAAWVRKFPSALARRGPAVLLLDHTTKTDGGLWPIGSQRKRAAITAQYILKIDQPYDRETSGGSNLICAKDRHGNYSYARLVARLSVSNDDGVFNVDLVDVESTETGDRGLSALERRILVYVDERMRDIHGQLDDEDEIMEGRPTYTKIREDVLGGVGEIKLAIARLVDRNLLLPVEVKSGKRRTVTLYEPGVRDFEVVEEED